MRPAVLVAVCAVLLALSPADARRRAKGPQLVQVIVPAGRAAVPAHPDVNIVVRFTSSADPGSFRARLGSRDITDEFRPLLDRGRQVGLRVVIPRDRIRVGRRTNRLRVLARGPDDGGKGRPPRQIVRVRFRAVDAPNQAPVANIDPESEVIFPEIPLLFDGSHSFDPELDELSYSWDFGEAGASSTEIAPSHTYASADEPRTVTLTVNDGQASTSSRLTLRSCPQPDGVPPGLIQVTAGAPLEFGAVAPGASSTRTFEVTNISADPTSRLAVCIGHEGAGFSLSPDRLELGSGERASVTVTFAPSATAHTAATIAVVSGATNRPLVGLVARGYGGSAPGNGPTLGSAPVLFYTSQPFEGIRGFLPTGAPFTLDTHVGLCTEGFGDACVTDGDCQANGGSCPQSDVCPPNSERGGQPCVLPTECPYVSGASPVDQCTGVLRYSCSTAKVPPLAPTEMCGDGAGGLYVLAEDTFEDPVPPENDYPLEGTLVRVTFDANGNTTGRAVLARTTEDTIHLACDGFAADAGGRVYIAETRSVPEVDVCFRDTREGLVTVRKSTGGMQTVMPRIDAAQGLSDCDDIDNTMHIEVSGDGSQAFASFDSNGLWRIRPSPLQFLDSSFFEETFRVHPDGSIVFATMRDGPSTSTVTVYKVTPEQVAAGPLPVDGLAPCATFQLPSNRLPSSPPLVGRGIIAGIGVSPAAPGSRDGTILVSVETKSLASTDGATPEESGRCSEVLAGLRNLTVRGTIAFSSAANSTSCTPVGLVNLEAMDFLTF